MKKSIFFEFTFLFILFIFAIITSKSYTIAWGLLPLYFGFSKNFKYNQFPAFKDFYIIFILFIAVFALNFFAVFSLETNHLEVPHPDFGFYLKVASLFNETGIENNLTAKTILFDNLDMATPYRFFDTWLLALLLKLLPFSALVVLQLCYLPLLWLMVSFSIYRNIDFLNNSFIKVVLSVSFLFLFGDQLFSFLLIKATIGEICVVSYPKLAIFFCVFIYYFRRQLNDKSKHDSILFLAFLPILIQTAFPLYIFIYLYILFYYKYFLLNKRIVISIFLSSIYYLAFYGYNFYLSKEIFQLSQFQFVNSSSEYFYRLASIVYNLTKSKLIIFIIITLIFVLTANFKRRIIYLRMIFLSFGILFSAALVYALFPSSPNSYQLMTNFTFPVFITVTFFIWMDGLVLLKNKFYILNCTIVFCLAIAGGYNQFNEFGFLMLKNKFSIKNREDFVEHSRQMLSGIKNPIGLTYWSKKNESRNINEHFDQYGTNFLMKLGADFDVVCLTALHTKEISYSEKVSKYYSAISLYQRLNNVSDNNLEIKFYNSYNFEYLISDLPNEFLPDFIKKDIYESVFDLNSKIYLYSLK